MDYFLAILMVGLVTFLVLYVPMVVVMDDIKVYRQDQTLKKERKKLKK